MSELKLSLEEELPSPDIFTDPEIETNLSIAGTSDEASLISVECGEPDLSDDPEWKGISIEEIYKHHGPFDWHDLPPIQPSGSHTVLFDLPLPIRGPPKAHPSQPADKWNQNFVRMPHSVHSLYPVDPDNETSGGFRRRWEVIQEALLQNFMSSHQLEIAILSYNHKYAERWDFTALHHLFNHYIDEEEMKICFSSLIPRVVQLALQLPDLITGPIPLLKRHMNKSLSLSQLQVASLLANAFFCTFPRRNSTNPQSEYGLFPYINFNRLFGAFREDGHTRNQQVMEKFRCILHYFRRVTTKAPEGTITIQRRYIPKKNCPRWDKQQIKLPSLHISSKGTIETQGAGLLQVDFANKYIGGGVLNYGCVQEEIRFVICPELMVTMLVTEALDDTEALIINGAERYSRYTGYSNTFKWVGDFVDETPRDCSGRLKTWIVAIDALYFKQPNIQYSMGNVIRELNKAYVGFSSEISTNNLPAIATGNWGCGAFRGNPQLKVLVQLMAAAIAGRSIVYFTFGDSNLRDSISDMYWSLIRHDVTVGRLFALISQYQEVLAENRTNFYHFLYNRSKIKPLTHYFTNTSKSNQNAVQNQSKLNNNNKSPEKKSQFNCDFKKYASIAKLKEDMLEEKIEKWLDNVENNIDIEESIKSVVTVDDEVEMQVEEACNEEKNTHKIGTETESANHLSQNQKKNQTFADLFGEKTVQISPSKRVSGLESLDKLLSKEVIELKNNVSMDVDIKTKNEEESLQNKVNLTKLNSSIKIKKKETQTKINDFFKKKD